MLSSEMALLQSQPDWNNLNVLQRNRLNARAHFYNYEDETTALTFDPRKSTLCHSLNGTWKFRHDLSPVEAPGWDVSDPSAWDDITVPGMWQLQGHGSPQYTNVSYPFSVDPPNVPLENETGSYFRKFTVPRQWTPDIRSVRLRFEGVDSSFHVWINGKDVGYSQGSRNAAEFDITSFLHPGDGSVNTVAVRVYKFCDGTYIEDQDQWWLSGIFRDVYLISFPLGGISDFTVTTSIDDSLSCAGVTAHVDRHGAAESFNLKLLCPDGKLLAQGEGTSEVHVELSGAQLRLWSAEQPILYTILLSCGNQVIPQRIGIRRVEVHDGNILVNKQPVIFYGVNRHEHHPTLGRAVPYEFMRQDLVTMKRHNVNAIRTSHYPNDPRMYEVADELGFYVINEADLECHGFYKPERQKLAATGSTLGRVDFREKVYDESKQWTSDNPAWEKAYVDRAVQLVERFKNSTCSIVWSLGNEAFYGKNLAAMYHWVKKRDPTRLVHYEADRNAVTADFYSSMYCTLEELRNHVTEKLDRPLILCEYAHAMGNGPGSLKEYIDIFRSEKLLQGGFIWQWANHGLLTKTGDGIPYYGYGGDFGDKLNDADFIMDGLLFSDHTPNPGAAEYKKVCEPVTLEGFNSQTGKISLRSHYFFSDLSHLSCSWSITVADQKPTESRYLALPHVSPGSTEEVKLPTECLSSLRGNSSHDQWVNLSFRLKSGTSWAPKDHEVAWAQLPIAASSGLSLDRSWQFVTKNGVVDTPVVKAAGGRLIISSPVRNAQVTFDLVRGGFKWTDEAGVAVLHGPELGIYRAMTSNDLGFGGDGAEWLRCMLDWTRSSVINVTCSQDNDADKNTKGDVTVTTEVRVGPPSLSWAVRATLEHVVSASLSVISIRVRGDMEHRDISSPAPGVLPRIGLDLALPKLYNHVEWFGRGPGEGYRDKKEASWVGLHSASVDELHVPYEVPQENGSRGDVRWVQLQNGDGVNGTPILEVRMAQGLFNFTARRHTPQELDRARHPYELRESDELLLHLDAMHHGLGSGSCGPPPFEAHRLYAQPFDFTVALRLL
ncbi:beta-galactosidase [Penicillium canescens]|nr:beta-galactosidase [Penicillium canescens]